MLEIRYNTQFYINGFKIDSFTSNVLDKFLLRSFEKSSIINVSKSIVDENQLSHTGNLNHFIENTERIKFVSSVSNVIERISVLGYTKEHAILDFEYCKNKIIDELSKSEYLNRVSRSFPDQDAFETKQSELNYFRNISFDDVLESFSEIIDCHLTRIIETKEKSQKSIIPREISNPLTRHIVCSGFGIFPFQNKLSLLRILIESANKNYQVEYEFIGDDITVETIENYYDELFNPNEINSNYGLKTLILTEGVTDKTYISESLNKLFPHLSDLYFFIDFNIKGGSTKSLIQILKSLAASGIPNKIIAIFDNDVEGIESIDSIKEVKFPDNIKILKLPDMELAKSYPVKQAGDNTDLKFENVNGKGCSIEMYLGKDVLTNADGHLHFLNKTGKLNQLNFKSELKKEFRKKFDKKLKIAKEEGNWEEMKLVLKNIFNN